MDNLHLNGINPNLSGGSPVQQPLNLNSDFLGYDNFKDWFDNWLDTLYGPTGAFTPIAGQVDFDRDFALIAENKRYDPTTMTNSDNIDNDIYEDIYSWIYDAVKAGNDKAYENWLKQAEYNAREAEKNRQFQEYMSNTSYQRAVSDLKKAGINPLLAFYSLSGASTPSGDSASSSMINSNSLYTGLMSTILGDKKIGLALLQVFTGIIEKILPSFSLRTLFLNK